MLVTRPIGTKMRPAGLDLDGKSEHAGRLAPQSQGDDDVADPAALVADRVEDRQSGDPGDEDAGAGGHGPERYR